MIVKAVLSSNFASSACNGRYKLNYYTDWNARFQFVSHALCDDGNIALEFITTLMKCQQVLRTNILSFIRRNVCVSFLFQQDNAAIYVNSSQMSWFRAHQVEELEWLACSWPRSHGKCVRHAFLSYLWHHAVNKLKNATSLSWQDLKKSYHIANKDFKKSLNSMRQISARQFIDIWNNSRKLRNHR